MAPKIQSLMITISPREQLPTETEEQIVRELKTLLIKSYIVREYGRQGDHPHLHVIGELDRPTRIDIVKQFVRRHHPQLFIDNKRLWVARQLKDEPTYVIAYYLLKEPNVEVLHTDYPLDSLPKPDRDYIRDCLVGKRIVSATEAPYVIVRYCQKYNIDIPDRGTELYQVCRRMYFDNYVVSSILKNASIILVQLRFHLPEPSDNALDVQAFKLLPDTAP